MRMSVAIAVTCLAITGLSTADEVQATIRQPTKIPAQALGQALQTLAKERRFQIVYVSEEVEDLRTPGAVGDYTAEEALTRLLVGTGLTYRYLDDQTVTVQAASSEAGGGSRPGKSQTAEGMPTAVMMGQASRQRSGQNARSSEARAREAERPAPAVIEEILVTAQKREERLIDIPQSVSVLTAQELFKIGAVQFRDFANTVPGLSFTTTGAGFTQISLRGVTAGFDVGSTVGIYVDDVPYGSSSAFAQGGQATLDVGLFDVQRIEVLHGPQGTLYGASTMGGLIKYVSKQPDSRDFGVEVRSGISSTHRGGLDYNGSIAVNAPLIADKAALRTSAFYSYDDGYIDNIAAGRDDVNRAGIYGGRIDLLLTPTDALTLRIGSFVQNISRDGEATADYVLSGVPRTESLEQRRLIAEPFEQRFRLVHGTATYDFGSATLTSISSYQTASTDLVYDVSGGYVPFCSFAGVTCSAVGLPQGVDTDKFTQEIRLASRGTGKLDWLVGGFYTHEDSDNAQSFSLRDLAGLPSSANLFTQLNGSRFEEIAGFANLTYHLTDKLDVSGGVRYAENRQSFTQEGSGAFGVTTPTRDSREDVATYLANARYSFSDHATAYVRYATGYRPGGPNFTLIDPETEEPVGPPTFRADRLKSYEVGVKSETADRRFGVDAAAYYIDWTDIRIAVSSSRFSGIENAGGATIQGAELTLTAAPIADLVITGAFAYQDATLSEAVPDLGGRDGERMPNVPRFTAAVSADYSRLGDRLQATLGATVRHVGERTASFDQSLFFAQYRLPDYTMVDLRAGITMASVDWQLYVHNLFDERGQLSAFAAYSTPGETKVSIAQPRTVGISASMSF